MLAFKFLAAGAIAPFTGRAWPLPGRRAPGAWLDAAPGELQRYGVHACRAEDLAWWADDELWVVELAPPFVAGRYHVAAARGRLLELVTSWNAELAREYAAASAWRARDVAIKALESAGLATDAATLGACTDLESLQSVAAFVAGDAGPHEPRALANYVAGAAMRARQGRYPEAALQCAHLGAAVSGTEAGADHERAWQSRWLADRLQLRDALARTGAGAAAV